MTVGTEGKSQTAALNFLLAMSKDTPTKLREQAQSSMNDLGYGMEYYKAV